MAQCITRVLYIYEVTIYVWVILGITPLQNDTCVWEIHLAARNHMHKESSVGIFSPGSMRVKSELFPIMQGA
jgi:hypothetical protein